MTEPQVNPIDELRTAYLRIPAGTPAAKNVLVELPRLYAAIEVVLNGNPCKELGEAYVECQRLLIEARAGTAPPDTLNVERLAEAARRAGRKMNVPLLANPITWHDFADEIAAEYAATPPSKKVAE